MARSAALQGWEQRKHARQTGKNMTRRWPLIRLSWKGSVERNPPGDDRDRETKADGVGLWISPDGREITRNFVEPIAHSRSQAIGWVRRKGGLRPPEPRMVSR